MLQEQEMLAEGYKGAKEIWAKMSDEELAVSPFYLKERNGEIDVCCLRLMDRMKLIWYVCRNLLYIYTGISSLTCLRIYSELKRF